MESIRELVKEGDAGTNKQFYIANNQIISLFTQKRSFIYEKLHEKNSDNGSMYDGGGDDGICSGTGV